MKKLLVLVLLIIMALGLCACGKKEISGVKQFTYDYEDTPIVESDNSIELTTSNLEDYLQIELSDANFDTHSQYGLMHYLSGDIVIDVYPVSSGSFENVTISLELSAPNKWFFLDKGSNYDETKTYPNEIEAEIKLHANGEGTYSYQIATENYGAYVYNRIEIPSDYSYQITSVSGTLVKD